MALRTTLGGQLVLAQSLRYGVLPPPQKRGRRKHHRGGLREDGRRRDGRPDRRHLHARPERGVRDQDDIEGRGPSARLAWPARGRPPAAYRWSVGGGSAASQERERA